MVTVRIIFIGIATYLAVSLSFAQPEPSSSHTVAPPNILWIIAEDLSPDLGCYGNSIVETPNLDELARRGMRFNNVFATAPVCSPSRTALATGMYQTTIGAYHMRYPENLRPALPPGIKTIAQLSQEASYLSANIQDYPGKGKTDWMFRADVDQQFDAYHWKDIARREQPFFAQLSTAMTHRSFEPATPGQFPLDSISIPPYYPDHPVSRRDFADYYASIERLDKEVGQILDSLKKYDLDKNTIIFFFSDHGRPMTRGKNYHYDSGLMVPLILSIPQGMDVPSGYVRGEVSNELLSTLDITATTLSLLGITPPDEIQGRVIFGSNRGEPREVVFSATNRIGETNFRSRSLRTPRYRYSRHYHRDFSVNSSATAYRKANHPIYHLLNIMHEQGQLTEAQQNLVTTMPYEELYDIQRDPFETKNLTEKAEYKVVLDSLRGAMDEWIEESGDQGLGTDSSAIEESFATYGKESAARYAEKTESLHQQVQQSMAETSEVHQ
ncbi:MAG: sulfatase [Cyclobacteriaceae bacterium]